MQSSHKGCRYCELTITKFNVAGEAVCAAHAATHTGINRAFLIFQSTTAITHRGLPPIDRRCCPLRAIPYHALVCLACPACIFITYQTSHKYRCQRTKSPLKNALPSPYINPPPYQLISLLHHAPELSQSAPTAMTQRPLTPPTLAPGGNSARRR